jgi:protein-S-isoprenylcysteine O-methyltransferase Ste14
MGKSKTLLNSAIVVYFVICFEILIMISPFAGFFYSAFNPVLLGFTKYRTTSWMSAFFFTHMVVPPNDFLKLIRIGGSVLFVFGLALFLACAVQVYASKFLKTGPALRGFYSLIRHPQYVGLAVAGLGLAVLWPRFLVLVLWIGMVLVYYALAMDEERRMRKQHPGSYDKYMEMTGMFAPKQLEDVLGFSSVAGRAAAFVVLSGLVLGGAFLLRHYTVHHLPLWTSPNTVALAIFPEDQRMMDHRMGDILNLEEVKTKLDDGAPHLVYFLPPNYVMQGLIANTGGDWQLYKRHHTVSRFGDWIIHPFSHLGGMHHSAYEPSGHSQHAAMAGTIRRLIFLKVSNVSVGNPSDVFAINAVRTPEFMLDLDVHELRVLDEKTLPIEAAWGKVPTPTF